MLITVARVPSLFALPIQSQLYKAGNNDFKPYYPGARTTVEQDGRYSDNNPHMTLGLLRFVAFLLSTMTNQLHIY